MTLITVCVSHSARGAQEVELRTISSRPDSVSGGDVLVLLRVPKESKWSAELNGSNVTRSFRLAAASRELIGLLTGLQVGKNKLEILVDGVVKSRLDLLDYPLIGPIFSGLHQQPFICQTESNGLGPPLDANCSAKTLVQYYYKSTESVEPFARPAPAGTFGPPFKSYDPSSTRPTDLAQTVTSDGRTVPYIVRREIGTINRAVYDIQFLHQPGQPLPSPWSSPTPGWNGRLIYLFGGGCGAGYRQGTLDGAIGAIQEAFLARGYAVATSTLNVFGNTCSDRISAETLSMVKEHFIKQFGEPVHTIGWGDSGGSMQVHLIAQNYPGLLDGIIPWLAFPDIVTTAQAVTDCQLLDHAFKVSNQGWTEVQKAAVFGAVTWRTCSQDAEGFQLANARHFCDPIVPKDLLYDRTTRPQGVRCDIYDNEIGVYGRDPRTGWAFRPLDNVGVQYGLAAFNGGKISAEQFLDLNKTVGGLDADGNIVSERTEAIAESVSIAYQRGLVLTGGGGLSQIPILEWRPYTDDLADGHDRFRSFVTRARLLAANGTADNQVILVYPRPTFVDYFQVMQTFRYDPPFADQKHELVRQMDRWLDNIAADHAPGSPMEKVARNKPSDLTDGCWATDGEHFVEHATYDGGGKCNQLYPPHANPRIVAGGPLTDDILKCALKPIDAADYSHPLNADQLQRLASIFPNGVCDYVRPGVGQEITRMTWQKH